MHTTVNLETWHVMLLKEVSTDAKKQARFRKGLSPELRRDLRLHECTSFQKLVNKAISAETG